MDDFRQLVESDHAVVGNYLKKHEMESPELYHRYLTLGINRDTKKQKVGLVLWLFFQRAIRRCFSFFTNNQMLLCHYTNKTILDRVILLKSNQTFISHVFMGQKNLFNHSGSL